jgi:hypothetical protein
MLLDESPVFRRKFVPWYDKPLMCLVTILFLDGVFLFSAAGISVARMAPAFYHHIWVPVLLMTVSGGLMLSILIRLIRRYARKSGRP